MRRIGIVFVLIMLILILPLISIAEVTRLDPALLDPANGNFHQTESSQVFDLGTNIGAYTDIDGDAVPMGAAPDIGADEAC